MPCRAVPQGGTAARATPKNDAIDWIARGYVLGDEYAQLLTHLAVMLIAPVALCALYLWLLAAVVRAALAHPSAGYHKQFVRATLAMPGLTLQGPTPLAGLTDAG